MSNLSLIQENTRDIVLPHPIEIFGVRHGQSLGQVDPSAYPRLGDPNLPLTELGLAQGHNAGTLLAAYAFASKEQPLTIYTSTCLRARQTAEQIFAVSPGGAFNEIVPDARIDKQKFGLFNGLFSSRERAEKYPAEFADYKEQVLSRGEFYARPPQGESIADLVDKAGAFLRDISAAGKPAIVVTHGLPLLCLEMAALDRDEQWVLDRQDSLKNCHIQHIYNDGRGGAFSTALKEGEKDRPAPARVANTGAQFHI